MIEEEEEYIEDYLKDLSIETVEEILDKDLEIEEKEIESIWI